MEEKNLVGKEKSFAGTIEKIKVLKGIKPSSEWVILARADLFTKISLESQQSEEAITNGFGWRSLFPFWWPAWRPKFSLGALYAVFMASGLFLSGTALTTWAAMKSMPGSSLYSFKIAIEKAHLFVSSGEGKSKLQSEITTRRLEELKTVVNSEESAQDKKEKVQTVMESLQSQMIADKNQLPRGVSGNETETTIAVFREAADRAEQVKKAIIETKDSLSGEIGANLSEKMTEIKEVAEKTSVQALEMLIAKDSKSDLEEKEILAKFEALIAQKKSALEGLDQITKISTDNKQASSSVAVADKLPINAVLINQTDEAKSLLEQIEGYLEIRDLPNALATLKALNEIMNGAEAIAEGSAVKTPVKSETQSEYRVGTSSPEVVN